MIKLKVNGQDHELAVDPQTPLLWVLREDLGLTGAKYSCGEAQCGACTVLVNGKATMSCVTTLAEVAGSEVTTIEGFQGPLAQHLQEAWLEEDVPQCGYCQPGQILTAADLLSRNPHPSEAEVKEAMSGVLCRCGTYQEIQQAIRKASERYGQQE